MLPANIPAQVALALAEDVGSGDVTASLVPAAQRVRARIVTREPAVLCGRPWVDEVFHQLDPALRIEWLADEGAAIGAGDELCRIDGLARPILTGERTALNFLQTLSATATVARSYAEAVAGTGCTILDTRKTIPGLRLAQKYAVRCGGASNHRLGLHDMVLVKENHIIAAGSIAAAVQAARRGAPGIRVEVEVESLDELAQALAAGADIVLLDDFTLDEMREAVRRTRASAPATKLEASGSVSLETVRTIAETGVDYVSVGALTKHVRAVDLSMRFDWHAATR